MWNRNLGQTCCSIVDLVASDTPVVVTEAADAPAVLPDVETRAEVIENITMVGDVWWKAVWPVWRQIARLARLTFPVWQHFRRRSLAVQVVPVAIWHFDRLLTDTVQNSGFSILPDCQIGESARLPDCARLDFLPDRPDWFRQTAPDWHFCQTARLGSPDWRQTAFHHPAKMLSA